MRHLQVEMDISGLYLTPLTSLEIFLKMSMDERGKFQQTWTLGMLVKDIKDPGRHFHQPHENGAPLGKESVEIIW